MCSSFTPVCVLLEDFERCKAKKEQIFRVTPSDGFQVDFERLKFRRHLEAGFTLQAPEFSSGQTVPAEHIPRCGRNGRSRERCLRCPVQSHVGSPFPQTLQTPLWPPGVTCGGSPPKEAYTERNRLLRFLHLKALRGKAPKPERPCLWDPQPERLTRHRGRSETEAADSFIWFPQERSAARDHKWSSNNSPEGRFQ